MATEQTLFSLEGYFKYESNGLYYSAYDNILDSFKTAVLFVAERDKEYRLLIELVVTVNDIGYRTVFDKKGFWIINDTMGFRCSDEFICDHNGEYIQPTTRLNFDFSSLHQYRVSWMQVLDV